MHVKKLASVVLCAYVVSGVFGKKGEYGKNQRCRDYSTGRRKDSG